VDDQYLCDFSTLFVAAEWITQHCPIPDGFRKGEPFEMSDWQAWSTLNHYRVRGDALWVPDLPLLGDAFEYWRSLIVGPQKLGKGPWAATICLLEAGGPALFAGWSEEGEQYVCAEHGCPCGWVYDYDPGEAKGMRWPTPLIQITATSEDQVNNIYRPLKSMIKGGPLAAFMRVTDTFVALGDDGRIDVVTSSANSRLGQPVTFVLNDETGIYTKTNGLFQMADTQMRGAAGMGGRTMQHTNCWDPSQQSTAQVAFESLAPGTFKFYRKPPANLSYANKEERRKIHQFNYGDSWWVSIDSIENVAAELMARDPAQAERFFGNRLQYGGGQWMPDELWSKAVAAGKARSAA
jgi:hypothetical protein